jgi:hypothetical protein
MKMKLRALYRRPVEQGAIVKETVTTENEAVIDIVYKGNRLFTCWF